MPRSSTKREESIRPMTTMEKWEMNAQQAYASKNPMDRLNVVPDIGPAAGMTRALKGKRVFHGTPSTTTKKASDDYFTKLGSLLDELSGGSKFVPHEELIAEARKRGLKHPKAKAGFSKFDPSLASQGAGGDLYGKGVYLTEHPKIAKGYADVEGMGVVRTHNLPPQAKILDLHREVSAEEAHKIIDAYVESLGAENTAPFAAVFKDRLNKKLDYWEKYPKTAQAHGGLTVEKLFTDILPNTVTMPQAIRKLGYDGVSYNAGSIGGLPKGVKQGTKNYVIYNYDILNNPRKAASERMFKPAQSAHTRYKSH